MPRKLLAIALMLGLAGPGSAARADGPVTEWGYLTTSDGARLRYTAVLPSAEGRFPVALIWSVYTDGVGPTGAYPPAESPVIAGALLDAGYAIVGVNMRGTGCSTGQWDLFQPASDGYEVVEWAASRDWSDGNVGMFGFSAPGISQLLTAATRPPSLRAITPADVTVDFYRDVAYPGGIPNVVFPPAWTLGSLPAHEALSIAYAADQGDEACAANIATRPVPNHGYDMLQFSQHPYRDTLWDRYSPDGVLDRIDVPILTCQAWQDDQVTSRAGSNWLDGMDRARTWAVFTNGPHGTCDDYPAPFTDQVVRFFDRYVRAIDNGFEDEPHVQVWHETRALDGEHVPAWVTTHETWPVPVEPLTLFLDGSLRPEMPEGTVHLGDYVSPMPSSSMESNEYQQSSAGWTVHGAPGGAVWLDSAPLAEDLEVFGPASVDVWLRSTASDVDVQATITEVRPDGQEMYVQRGWLRASHRALDAARSTALRPFHTHRLQDAQDLPAAEPALLRIELNPFGHVFRAGSAVRLTIDSPTGLTGLFGFGVRPAPALNTLTSEPAHPARLVLGRVPGGSAGTPLPACDELLSQPCRTARSGWLTP